MITLSLLQYLQDNGLGIIDEDLFWQKLGVDREGVYIVELGGNNDRGSRRSTTYELYSRHTDDVKAYQKLEDICKLLNRSYSVCRLPPVPEYSNREYQNVTIMPVSPISNAGLDVEGRVVFSTTGIVYYE